MNTKKQKGIFSSKKLRFIAVGGLNTATDFSILFLLAAIFSVPVLFANGVSTTCGLVVSYTLNKKAVFKDGDATNLRQVTLFVVITLTGLWILQGAIIWLVNTVLSPLQLPTPIALLVAKLIATLFSLTWNYLWYSRVVFRQRNASEE